MISFDLIAHEKSLATRDYSNLKTNLAISSMEDCGCLFDESNIGTRLSSGGGHGAMMPPHQT